MMDFVSEIVHHVDRSTIQIQLSSKRYNTNLFFSHNDVGSSGWNSQY